MKNLNFGLVPTVIGFDENNLKERIISIMKFKKPTALTTALSALLVVGIGSTAAFAVSPKTEDPVSVPEPELTVTTSEPVPEINPADNNSETGEPESIDFEDELESKYPRGEHSVPLFPEDKNGIYYSESGDMIRVPVRVLDVISLPTCAFSKGGINDKGTIYVHAIVLDEFPNEYHNLIYGGDEFAVLTRNEAIRMEQIALYRQMEDEGIIPYTTECFHDLNSLD